MFTEIRCEICINHCVEIIFTLSCAVVCNNLCTARGICTRKCEQILCPGTFILFVSTNGCLYNFLHIFNKKFCADCRNLTDGRTDIKCLSNGRKNLITLKDQTNKNVSNFSRNMFTEIRCEICINHFVERGGGRTQRAPH
jgi:hypothetical protein